MLNYLNAMTLMRSLTFWTTNSQKNCSPLLNSKMVEFKRESWVGGDVTSSDQDVITNVVTLVCRRGVRGSHFILCHVFLSTLALEKIMLSSCCFAWISWRHKKIQLIQIIAGLRFGNLSNGRQVYPGYFFTKIVSPDPNLQIYLLFGH